jgi:hypothetical protein
MPTLRVSALISREDPRHSSRRTVQEVAQIFDRVNEIWRQADIRFDVTVQERKFDPESLDEIVKAAFQRRGDTEGLSGITGHAPLQITAIYLRSIGGSNGKVFRPKKALIVVDDTTMPAGRTTAHEIGHFFELEHWLDRPPPDPPDRPPSHLMARTQMGTDLIPRDIDQVKGRLPTSGLEVVD